MLRSALAHTSESSGYHRKFLMGFSTKSEPKKGGGATGAAVPGAVVGKGGLPWLEGLPTSTGLFTIIRIFLAYI